MTSDLCTSVLCTWGFPTGAAVLMIGAGMLGAYCRYIFDRDDASNQSDDRGIDRRKFVDIAIPGVVAAFVVPLFLSIGESEVFTNIVIGKEYAKNSFILFAFCLLAAASARSFVNALAQQALQKAKTAQEDAEEAKDLVSEEKSEDTGAQLPDTQQRQSLVEK